MAQAGSLTTKKVIGLLTGSAGLPANVAALSTQQNIAVPLLTNQQVVAQNVTVDIAEKSGAVKYPVIHVYTEKVLNALREKFRGFSGETQPVIEIRVSQDRLDGLEAQLHLYVDAVTQVLDGSRGDLGDGFFYAGGYDISYGPVTHGGRNFLQIAKVSFTLDLSTN